MNDKNTPRCIRCGRTLKDPQSIRRHYGPVCAAHIAKERDRDDSTDESIQDEVMEMHA